MNTLLLRARSLTRNKAIAAGTAAVAVAVAGIAVVHLGNRVDELAYRNAAEAHLGHQIPDWPTVLDIAHDTCHLSKDQFALQAAMFMDRGSFEDMAIGVRFVCPDRSDEILAAEIELPGGALAPVTR
jgi:hypothetical protein